MSFTIEYEGIKKTFKYKHELSDADFNKIVKEFRQRYTTTTYDKLKRNIELVHFHNGVKIDDIKRFYFNDLFYSSRKNYWSVNDVLNHKPLLEVIYGYIIQNMGFWLNVMIERSSDYVSLLDRYFCIGGLSIAQYISNFKLKSVYEIIDDFNVNGNFYDPSCGWGVRMTGSLQRKINYYGTEPNNLLADKLNEYSNEYKKIVGDIGHIKTDIKTLGAEIFIPEYVNKMGLIFTSPPYYNLEDYRFGEQSIKKNKNYNDWINNFVEPMIDNCVNYCISGGYIIFNVKNISKYNIYDDFHKILSNRKELVKIENNKLFKNDNRPVHYITNKTNDEGYLIFNKK